MNTSTYRGLTPKHCIEGPFEHELIENVKNVHETQSSLTNVTVYIQVYMQVYLHIYIHIYIQVTHNFNTFYVEIWYDIYPDQDFRLHGRVASGACPWAGPGVRMYNMSY